jgi:hypothetical protein
MRLLRLAAFVILATATDQARSGFITNGSFETGNFSGWGTQDISPSLMVLAVRGNGISNGFGSFSTQATQGVFSASHGFDGGGPAVIRMFQDIGVVDSLTNKLQFDYRAAWDMLHFGGSTIARLFTVNVYQSGGFGTLLGSFLMLTANPGTNVNDTGNLLGTVDLSSLNGQAVRLSFDCNIPEFGTGPGFFQLDNVRLAALAPEAVPLPATAIPCGLGALGLVVATMFRRMTFA